MDSVLQDLYRRRDDLEEQHALLKAERKAVADQIAARENTGRLSALSAALSALTPAEIEMLKGLRQRVETPAIDSGELFGKPGG